MNQAKIPKNIFKKYPGKRVALVDGKVVAVSSNSAVAYNIILLKKNILIKKLVFLQFPEKKISISWYDFPLAGKKFQAQIAFSSSLGVGTNLLGLVSFFDEFSFCFHHSKKYIEINQI